jgi:hypothetical protein
LPVAQLTTKSGLALTARVDERKYATRVRDAEMKALKIHHHDINPQWNFPLSPRLHYQWS